METSTPRGQCRRAADAPTAVVATMTKRLATARRELAYTLRSATAPFPAHCTLEVNYDCQARCESCTLWTKDFKRYRIGERQVLTTAEALGVIADLAANGCTTVFFCGG